MELKKAIEKLHAVFGRGNIDIGSFDVVDNVDSISVKNQLESFYSLTVFEDVLTIGGEFFLDIQPEIKIKRAQEGWYFILDKEGELQCDDLKWDKNWIVFANRNDDAVYFNKADGGIYGSIDKRQFFHLSSSLADFFCLLSECMKMEEEKYEFDTSDDDEEPLDILWMIRYEF